MTIVITVSAIFAAVILGFFLTTRAAESESFFNYWTVGAFVYWVLAFSLVIGGISHQEEKGPCLQYETTMQWNPAAKTMMPAKYCTLRAEWVKP